MKHITLLIPRGSLILSSIVGPFKIFSKVNGLLQDQSEKHLPFYQIDLVGSKSVELYDGLFSIHCNKELHQITKTDLILIPSITSDPEGFIRDNQEMISWIKKQYEQGAEIASFCTGAFLLASTGLVNGKSCSTHWLMADVFKKMFPKVLFTPEKIVTEENGIYSSGGAYSFLNLILYLIEKYNGREIALIASKVFEIEIDRFSQSQFIIFNTQKNHSDQLIKNIQDYIEQHVSEKITNDHLSEQFAISNRNLIRRFKKATGNTPIEYIQKVKIEVAKKSFETEDFQVNEVMYGIGYNDQKSFRTIFKKLTGLTPIKYKERYNRKLAYN